MERVWLVVLGAVLALITSVVTEYVRFRVSDDRSKRTFRTVIAFMLPEIAGVLEQLLQDAATGGVILLGRLDELNSVRALYDKYFEQMLSFKDVPDRREIYDTLDKLSVASANARIVEGIASMQAQAAQSNPAVANSVTTRRRELVEEFRNLNGRIPGLKAQVDQLR
jgi:hypothetical protein